jgi:hypothetical protein
MVPSLNAKPGSLNSTLNQPTYDSEEEIYAGSSQVKPIAGAVMVRIITVRLANRTVMTPLLRVIRCFDTTCSHGITFSDLLILIGSKIIFSYLYNYYKITFERPPPSSGQSSTGQVTSFPSCFGILPI